MRTPLSRKFYEPSAQIVAANLLGHWLIHRTAAGDTGGLIVETEAYLANDAACHAFHGPTKRTQAMWGAPGHGYVYFIYGNHWCFNAVCLPSGMAEAVLIRAIDPRIGIDLMRQRRTVKEERQLTNGPGKLCAALGINKIADGADLCDPKSPVIIAKNPSVKAFIKESGPVVISTRIGIIKAAELPLRFYLEHNRFVSAHRTRLASPEKLAAL